jgi:urease accessory protein
MKQVVRIGIGGPVGAGKSHLLLKICEGLREQFSIVAITNDIYTREDAQFLISKGALVSGRILGIETGGCPHAAIRDDISLNADALELLQQRFPDVQLAFVESGGDNLSAFFSPDLVDYFIYIIDVAQGGDIPRKGGIGITRSDMLIVNKIDLAPHVEVDLEQMHIDVQAARGPLPYLFTDLKNDKGVAQLLTWISELMSNPQPKGGWGKGASKDRHHHHHHG